MIPMMTRFQKTRREWRRKLMAKSASRGLHGKGYPITDTADGFNTGAVGAKFFPKPSNVSVQGARCGFAVIPPDPVHQGITREHVAARPQQFIKEVEFLDC